GKGGKSKPVLEERTTIRELLKMIKRGTSYEEMSVQFGISSGSVRNYIQARKRLFDEYVKVQNGIRVTANGGLKINKKHGR
ncbi:MAG: sigma-70 region 4 domain-containing protein, partial [Spirochaetaceae bacterium]|nr:sigma-70 region 4 domain-containing protein [Spirochaetaceae bacterium]